ncbi:MAG: CheY-like chemotaxis protein [Flavobacteriales bacterium]|jgi:CheY-like chemotaxis protein
MIKKVLYLESDPVSLFVGYTMLGECYDFDEIITAKDGETGLEKLQENNIDLIIMEFAMPVIDGEEFILEAHKQNPNRKTPIAVITGVEFEPSERKKVEELPNVIFVDRKPMRKSQVPKILELLGVTPENTDS